MSAQANYAFFVLVRALPAWLRLPREERGAISAREWAPILRRHDRVRLRTFDAEAFYARGSDVFLFETEAPEAYYFLMEAVRDSSIFTEPYFELIDIIPAIEDGFRRYEAEGVG